MKEINKYEDMCAVLAKTFRSKCSALLHALVVPVLLY